MKLKSFIQQASAVAIFFATALSCVKTDPQDQPQEDDYPAAVTLSIEKLEMNYTASELLFKLTSDHQWKAEASESWVTLSKSEGEGSAKGTIVYVKAPENQDRKARTADIVITSGATVVKLPVTQKGAPWTVTPEEVQDYDKIYIPREYRSHGFLQGDAVYFFGRSAQSDHFILFWSRDYEDVSPDETTGFYHVDTRKVLDFLESCFATYTGKLEFAELGQGKSRLDQYKMMIFLTHERKWRAEGFGYDDMVGCFWVNPEAANSLFTIAHEIGHSFQYQVYCDQLLQGQPNDGNRAWRWNSGKGQGFWEQTAQWQATVMRPEEVLTDWQFTGTFPSNAHRHILHEDMRYGSYFIHHYWADKRGWNTVGRVWRSAAYPDDALAAYQHLFGLTLEELNAELFEYATKCVTWDFSLSREAAGTYLNKIPCAKIGEGDGWYRIRPKSCPEATGFNIWRLTGWTGGETVEVSLEGLPNFSDEYLKCDAENAGWTVGFVGLSEDGVTRYYSSSAVAATDSELKASISWAVPEGCKYVWAVVSATPTKYYSHVWDEDNTNDNQWPYRLKFTGATIIL